MRPGEYRSEEFEPSFSFSVGKGWRNDRLETSDKLAISRGREGQHGELIFRNVQEVYEYDKTGTTPAVVKAPKDMVGWFRHHPYRHRETGTRHRRRSRGPAVRPHRERGCPLRGDNPL